ncbi:MAG: esterase-like activity of phytase family protein [Gammaproteobacteria bacterium]
MFTRLFLPGFILVVLASGSKANDIGTPYDFSKSVKNGDTFMGIRLLGAVKLSTDKVNGLGARELSGLAWDEDEQMLHAVSDDGYLVHLNPVFTNGFLTGVSLIDTRPLRDPDGNVLEGVASDAESLAILKSNNGILGDSELVISLEFPPRIGKFRPDGFFITYIPLPDKLTETTYYSDKDATLDALALHPRYGFITAPQKPLINSIPDLLSIYSLDGEEWHYTPLNYRDSTTLGLETLADGDLLVIERVYSSFLKPVVYALRKLRINEADGSSVAVEEIAHFSSREGWLIDNFESVARHRDNRYFMVSDDNENAFQKTLLVYFEIVND